MPEMRYWVIFLLAIVPQTLPGEANHSALWGFFGHRLITEMAVYSLPMDLVGFYKEHKDYLVEGSVKPDKRRYVIDAEGPRHYIDLDLYDAVDSIPKYWLDAVQRYGEDSLAAHGLGPWHTYFTYSRLVEAMEEKRLPDILRLSADLSHYVADANVPLHTTSNYNGQFTNQVGIHGFWESRLPELFSDEYDFFIGQATYVADPQAAIWSAVHRANNVLDSLLTLDKTLTERMGKDKKYGYESRGKTLVKVPTKKFSKAYHEAFPYVEQQMRASIKLIGDLWFTAWVNAGQPDLSTVSFAAPVIVGDTVEVRPLTSPQRAHEN